MRLQIPGSRFRWALLASVAFHIVVIGSVSGWMGADPDAEVDNLGLVQVDPTIQAPPAIPEIAPLPLRDSDDRVAISPLVPPRRSPPARRPARLPKVPVRRAALSHPAPAIRPEFLARRSARIAAPRPAAPSYRSTSGGRPTTHTGSPPQPPQSPAAGDDADQEDVPDGPTDLGVVGGEDDATETTPLTRGALVVTNVKVKGQARAGLIRVKPFSGPGVLCVQTLTVPVSAPPGTVYQLKVSGTIADRNARTFAFTPISGSLTVVPARTDVPPAVPPPQTGPVLGVGRLFAHRGDRVKVEVYAGDGIKEICGIDVIVNFDDRQVPPRKKPKNTLPQATSPSGAPQNSVPSAPPSPAAGPPPVSGGASSPNTGPSSSSAGPPSPGAGPPSPSAGPPSPSESPSSSSGSPSPSSGIPGPSAAANPPPSGGPTPGQGHAKANVRSRKSSKSSHPRKGKPARKTAGTAKGRAKPNPGEGSP